MSWSLHMHMGITWGPIPRNGTHRATCARAPRGSQTHLHLFRSSREPLPMGCLQSVCPLAKAIPCFPCMPCNAAPSRLCTLRPVPEYPTPLCRSCFSLRAWLLSHPASALTTFQDLFFTFPWGFPAAIPSLSSAAALLALSFASQLPAFYSHLVPLTNQQVVSFSQGVGHGLDAALLSELMNTPTGRRGEKP